MFKESLQVSTGHVTKEFFLHDKTYFYDSVYKSQQIAQLKIKVQSWHRCDSFSQVIYYWYLDKYRGKQSHLQLLINFNINELSRDVLKH